MDIKQKLVDILCPVHNKKEYLHKFISSFTKLDCDVFNLIMVDDGSADGSCELIKKYADENDNIFVIAQSNQGVSSARNKAISYSVSNYVWFCDPDDEILSDVQYKMCSVLKSNKYDVVRFGYIEKDKTNSTCYIFGEYSEVFLDFLEKNNYYIKSRSRSDICPIWNKVYRRDLLKDTLFNTNVSYGEDRLFNMDFFSGRGVLYSLSDFGYVYNRETEGSLSRKSDFSVLSDLKYVNRYALKRLNDEGKYKVDFFWIYVNKIIGFKIEKFGFFKKIFFLKSEADFFSANLVTNKSFRYLLRLLAFAFIDMKNKML